MKTIEQQSLLPAPGSAPVEWEKECGCVKYYRWDTQGGESDEEADACAKLYGAAPEMLEALKRLVFESDRLGRTSPGIRDARAAIAKATGQ